MNHVLDDTIVALSTPTGVGAIAMIRLSGPQAIQITDKIFLGKKLSKQKTHTIHFGKIMDGQEVVDEVLISLFKNPNSYTGQNTTEISCHGSAYISEQIIKLCLKAGARTANPGEFTMRAFLNGQLDLSQAEAVADLISSETHAQHELAINQMRGGYSNMIKSLRDKLIEFASLLELENDFSEEDVEFADRSALVKLITNIKTLIAELLQSFDYGNAIKEGIPVAIIGKPNVGKSTLLNALLNEDRAIISATPGTTRDVIEDTIQLGGILFRFIDTAGIRDTHDEIESMGILKTKEQIEKAQIILYIDEIKEDHTEIVAEFNKYDLFDKTTIILLNKIDDFHKCHSYDVEEAVSTLTKRTPTIAISAKEGNHVEKLKTTLTDIVNKSKSSSNVVVSNLRHHEALNNANAALQKVLDGLGQNISSDFLALDIRYALSSLGEISGEVSTDDLLDSIFRNFCIGK